MSTNCVRCVVNKRTGVDLLCDGCRHAKNMVRELAAIDGATTTEERAAWCKREIDRIAIELKAEYERRSAPLLDYLAWHAKTTPKV